MLTEEQRESVRYASEWLGRSDDIGNQKHAERLRTLLATHNARAQEPVAWRTSGNDLYLENPGYDDWEPLYAHPQPMPQKDASRHLSNILARIHRDGGHYEAEHGTDKAVADADDKVAQLNALSDAARDVIEAARIVLGAGLAKDISGNGVKVFVTSVSAAERLSAASAEIERIAREKGE